MAAGMAPYRQTQYKSTDVAGFEIWPSVGELPFSVSFFVHSIVRRVLLGID
jgi:hypothetical protein